MVEPSDQVWGGHTVTLGELLLLREVQQRGCLPHSQRKGWQYHPASVVHALVGRGLLTWVDTDRSGVKLAQGVRDG
jgi:hypothetical protein